jgi:hypothetical protein
MKMRFHFRKFRSKVTLHNLDNLDNLDNFTSRSYLLPTTFLTTFAAFKFIDLWLVVEFALVVTLLLLTSKTHARAIYKTRDLEKGEAYGFNPTTEN